MSRPTFPSAEEGLEFHRRLVENDPVATKDVCERFDEPLLAFLMSRDGRADEQACTSAVSIALLGYVQRPESFDPEKLDLSAFLRLAARRDLSNLARAEAKHHRRREPDFRVEDACVGGNHFEDDPAAALVRGEEQESARCQVEAIRAACDEPERVVLEAMLDEERSTKRIATAIGLGELPEREQRREVKRVKDRIKKRIERGGGSNGEAFGRNGRADPA